MSAPPRFAASGAFKEAIYSLSSKALWKRLLRKAFEGEYPSDEPTAADTLRATMPNFSTIREHDRSRQEYTTTVVRKLKQCRREGRSYIRDTAIHDVYASHDRIGDREGMGGYL